jgi:hypothetical protein
LRIVSCGIRWAIAHETVSRRPPISLDTIVARTEGYTRGANVWDLFIVQGPFSIAPCQTLAVRFATFASLYVAPLYAHARLPCEVATRSNDLSTRVCLWAHRETRSQNAPWLGEQQPQQPQPPPPPLQHPFSPQPAAVHVSRAFSPQPPSPVRELAANSPRSPEPLGHGLHYRDPKGQQHGPFKLEEVRDPSRHERERKKRVQPSSTLPDPPNPSLSACKRRLHSTCRTPSLRSLPLRSIRRV